MFDEQKITEHDFRILKDQVYAPLMGLSEEERLASRTTDFLTHILDQPDAR
jgi:hypothetical protein